MFDNVARARLCLTLPGWLLRLCLTRGMSYARARGFIVVAIVQRDRHVVRLRTRPYRCRPSGNVMYEAVLIRL